LVVILNWTNKERMNSFSQVIKGKLRKNLILSITFLFVGTHFLIFNILTNFTTKYFHSIILESTILNTVPNYPLVHCQIQSLGVTQSISPNRKYTKINYFSSHRLSINHRILNTWCDLKCFWSLSKRPLLFGQEDLWIWDEPSAIAFKIKLFDWVDLTRGCLQFPKWEEISGTKRRLDHTLRENYPLNPFLASVFLQVPYFFDLLSSPHNLPFFRDRKETQHLEFYLLINKLGLNLCL